ncbi:MAG: diaminopropionate ammonia-lyase [Candidatus Marinimicrobia bacterium]|jgi:diaminopropionate ammonia-lyase|nr:diaminopropionate ammonia-lyase [Candidatus Neomarinimicrobiota bacterium]MBT3848209.1 diaminopropionate ammonia-lyase [Candidatus Neomarinimicrobiota bacterium]MBT4054117.1 diaminopropionate ammonia-lyase [Candidatus Neomarinimicrobiota bacterium]MBT4370348.1 diaminopropionate ammonia-lyase [Candidatus Neomarinimicrobiota bacterium]MBT4663018.1 diaminopropionate ammonia-lyase [Candidatus Neomarinimicrobiota bacterium]
MICVIENNNFSLRDVKQTLYNSSWDPKEVADFHETIGNKETPLVKLPGLAKRLGIGSLLLKDESHRFGINAFKALGASYAMYRQIEKNPQIKTFCTATDGNHGRAVAWMARKLGRKALIYMPQGTVSDRVRAIEQEGADVFVIDQAYDIAVKMASTRVDEANNKSGKHFWSLIQDTAWDGYEDVPLDIMKGYWTQMHEITRQIGKEKIDVLFLQTGVGSWAASIIGYIMKEWQNPPACISVEPHSANCLFESIKTGNRVSVKNDETTTMAGLNCGSVSTLAWNILKNGLVGSISISDKLSEEAMITLASPVSGDPVIISGESGASGLGALIGLCKKHDFNTFKEKICLNKTSTVLVINTEGDTDRSNYKRVMAANIENNFQFQK